MNPNAFTGTLTPDPNEFTINVKRFTPKGDSIALECDGVQDGEKWAVSTTLTKKSGYYYSQGPYEGCSESEGMWRIWILDLDIIDDAMGGQCRINGLWFDTVEPGDESYPSGGYLWAIHGVLEPLNE